VTLGEKKVGVMTYDVLGPRALDYLPCRYGTSKLLFRGPRRDLGAPYVAFLGGTQTFGKFIEQPYPLKVEHLTGVVSVNLGQVNAGVDVYAKDACVQQIARNARVAVLEVPCAVNMSNTFYKVHPRRNDRFVRASPALRRLYPEVDFAQFNFTGHMVEHLHRKDAVRFAQLAKVLRSVWLRRVRRLTKQLSSPVILLRFRGQPSTENSGFAKGGGPALVTNAMIEAVRPAVQAVVDVPPLARHGGTQAGDDVSGPLGQGAANAVVGPDEHSAAAQALVTVLDQLM
jgi:hypothetical protein